MADNKKSIKETLTTALIDLMVGLVLLIIDKIID